MYHLLLITNNKFDIARRSWEFRLQTSAPLKSKTGPVEMGVFLRAKALKTENVNLFLCDEFAPVVKSFRMITGCMLFDTNCMCYIEFGLRALFLSKWAAVGRVARAIDLNLNARLSMPD